MDDQHFKSLCKGGRWLRCYLSIPLECSACIVGQWWTRGHPRKDNQVRLPLSRTPTTIPWSIKTLHDPGLYKVKTDALKVVKSTWVDDTWIEGDYSCKDVWSSKCLVDELVRPIFELVRVCNVQRMFQAYHTPAAIANHLWYVIWGSKTGNIVLGQMRAQSAYLS